MSGSVSGGRWGKRLEIFILSLIFLNVAAVILESVQSVQDRWGLYLAYFEIVSVWVFSIEYVLRLWSCTEEERFRHPIIGRFRYITTPAAIIDLFAILPFLLTSQFDARGLRILRMLRLFTLAKTGRYYRSVRLLGRVFISKKEELMITFSLLIFMLIITSSFMYAVECHAQPEAFASIPHTMWWAVATLTTVGYGDVAPITGMGRFLGAIVAIIGIGLFALPASILGSGFMEEVNKARVKKVVCPHCEHKFDL